MIDGFPSSSTASPIRLGRWAAAIITPLLAVSSFLLRFDILVNSYPYNLL